MTDKKCARCRVIKAASIYFRYDHRMTDGWSSYCKQCYSEVASINAFKNKTEWWHWDGFASEKDHFNYALTHYADIFNCPQLLNYRK